ncbi:MAG: Spy/CpxP family protein refolding chaperone [Woeseiaceae bacterium]|nr:Spy/CpxP family protein refolding chaperone [Woeseiaceae bacterium]
MKKTTIAFLATVSLAAFSTAALAERGGPPGAFGGGPGFMGPGLMLEHMADHLDLDDAQRDAVNNIIEASKPEIQALREKVRANREALEALDANDAAYSAELNNIAISNGELATEGTLLFTRIRTELHAVLTDEQIAKLERGKERMKKRFKERRQRS